MSAICILAPVISAAWPALGAAANAAAVSLGYQVVADQQVRAETRVRQAVEIELPNSEVVSAGLGRDQRLRVRREDITLTFSRDVRGRASVCVDGGEARTEEELEAIGREFGQRVVQQYIYQRLQDEMRTRGYHVVEESVDDQAAIRLRVRHWEA